MRVIKEKWIKEEIAFCNYCGAEIGYYPHDKKVKALGTNLVTYLICPVCGKAIILEKEDY